MPQGLTVPAWYNDNYYINEKVDECNTIRFGDAGQLPWTTESVRSFLAAANGEADYQPWMGYENFVSNGNAENCSPNPLFNVMEYLTAKANQLNALDEGAGYEGSNAWTAESVLRYFNDHGITAWDHFTTAGQFEGVNPSNAMDLSEFLTKKAAQCNEMQFDDRDDWTPESVLAYYQEHGINAVEVAVNDNDPNVTEVPAAEQVIVPEGETPWGTATIIYNDIPLVAGKNDYEGTEGNDNFMGVVGGREATFTQNTNIDGGEGHDKLSLDMNGNFNGFRNDGALANVEEVSLSSTGKGSRSFNAEGITGVETWTLDETKGSINLNNVEETGAAVNIKGLAGKATSSITFAKDVAGGSSDEMTLGLDDVGTPAKGSADPTFANIKMAGIEDVTLNVSGDNYANLSGLSAAETFTIGGTGDLTVNEVAQSVETVDAVKAAGDLNLDLSKAVDFQNATLGSGNDNLVISNLEETSEIDGGKGDDTVTFDGVGGRYQPVLTSVETLTLDQKAGQILPKLTIAGDEISGLENLVVRGMDASEDILFAEYATGELNVNAVGDNAGNLEIGDVDQINMTVGGTKGQETFSGKVILNDTSSLNLTVGNTTERGDVFSGDIIGTELENLSIVANRNNLGNNSEPTVILGKGSDITGVSDITVSGFGGVDLRGYSALGSNAENLTVDASTLNAQFKAAFAGSANSDTLSVTGSALQNNEILVNGSNYSLVSITGGLGVDRITLMGNGANVTLEGSLGRDDIIYLAAGATNWDTAKIAETFGIEQTQIVQLAPNQPPADVVDGGSYLAPENSTQDITAKPSGEITDLSGLTYENGNGTTNVSVGNGADVILPQSGNVKATAGNLGDSSGVADLTLTAAPKAGETQTVEVNQVGKSYTGQSTFDFTNDGEGQVVLATSVTDTNSAGKEVTEFNQTTINLEVTNPNGSIVAFGQNLNDSGEGGKINSNRMPNVTEINLDGAGDIDFSAQMGSGSNNTLAVNASDMTGNISGLALYSKVVTANLGSGDDSIQVTPYATGSVVNAGAGADHINLSWAYAGNSVKNVITVDLGVDSDADVLGLYSAFESSNASAGAAFVQVKNFNAAQDTLSAGSTGTTRLNHFVETSAEVWNAAITIYTGSSSTVSVTGVEGAQTAGIVFCNGNAYLMAQGGGTSAGWGADLSASNFSSVKGNVCIVELQGVTSGDFATITGQGAGA